MVAGVGLTPRWLLAPVILMLILSLSLGIGMWAAALCVEYRDVGYIAAGDGAVPPVRQPGRLLRHRQLGLRRLLLLQSARRAARRVALERAVHALPAALGLVYSAGIALALGRRGRCFPPHGKDLCRCHLVNWPSPPATWASTTR